MLKQRWKKLFGVVNMFTHKKILYSLLLISCALIIGCAGSYAPNNYLPETEDVPQNVYGGWITVTTAPDSLKPNDKWMMYGGEFIASGDSDIYLLYDSLYRIPKRNITESTLELDAKNTGAYGGWVAGGSLLTISNGYYLVFTLPLWLVAGIPSVSGESIRDRYEMDEPTQEYWNSIKMFARFPQGVGDIDLSQIKPLTLIQKSE
jgi:hypothetical protein